MTTVQSTATHTTPGLKRLRLSPAARRVRQTVVADQREALLDAATRPATTTPPARQKRAQRSPSESGGRNKAGKGAPAGGKITVLDAKRTFSGATGKCWQLLRAAKTVEGYLAAGERAGIDRTQLRFNLRHFTKTLGVARLG